MELPPLHLQLVKSYYSAKHDKDIDYCQSYIS